MHAIADPVQVKIVDGTARRTARWKRNRLGEDIEGGERKIKNRKNTGGSELSTSFFPLKPFFPPLMPKRLRQGLVAPQPVAHPAPILEQPIVVPPGRDRLPISRDVLLHHILPFLTPANVECLGRVNKQHKKLAQLFCTSVFPRLEFGRDKEWVEALTTEDVLWYYRLVVHMEKSGNNGKQTRAIVVPKSIAKELFRITPAQVDALPGAIVRNNPHFSRAAPMVLVPLASAFEACIKRHKSVAGLHEYIVTLTHRKKQRVVNARASQVERQAQLTQALTAKGLHQRNDSNLCQQWLDKSSQVARTWTLEAVVQRCCQVHFLHNYCPEFKTALQQLRTAKHDDYEYLSENWHDGDAHDQYHEEWDDFDFVREAESRCVPHIVTYPLDGAWPWQQEA
jgi:hypothetical protein